MAKDSTAMNARRIQSASAPIQKRASQQTVQEAEQLRNVSLVIRPIAGPWSPGAILGGVAPAVSVEQESLLTWLPKGQLSADAIDCDNASKEEISQGFVIPCFSPSFMGGVGLAKGLDQEMDGALFSSSMWLHQQKALRKVDDGDHSFKFSNSAVNSDSKLERYMELKATGSAALQHLDFLMKHTEVLIEQAEQSFTEASTVHGAHSRYIQENLNAVAADACAKAAIEQLETFRRVLSGILPRFATLQSPEQFQQESMEQAVKLGGLKVSDFKEMKAAIKDERETSLTLACGGSYTGPATNPVSPGRSGESGGGSTCEDDAPQVKPRAEESHHEAAQVSRWEDTTEHELWARQQGLIKTADLTSGRAPSSEKGLLGLTLSAPRQLPRIPSTEAGMLLLPAGGRSLPPGSAHAKSPHPIKSNGTPDPPAAVSIAIPSTTLPPLCEQVHPSERPQYHSRAPPKIPSFSKLIVSSPSSTGPIACGSPPLLPVPKAETMNNESEEEDGEDPFEERRDNLPSHSTIPIKRSPSAEDPSHVAFGFKRQRTRHQEEEVPGDTWHWRKYGQKVIKDTPLYRSYYRCGCRKGTICAAKRHVDRYIADNRVSSVVYEGEHCHTKPPPKIRTTVIIQQPGISRT